MFLSRIGIVGGGPATVSLLRQIFDSLKYPLKQKVNIDVYEKSNKIGPGLAYSNRLDCYLLNLPVSSMGVTAEINNNFQEWLVKKGETISSFPPRYYFGEYLEEIAEKLKQEAKELNIELGYHPSTTVKNIYPLAPKQYLIFKNSQVQIEETVINGIDAVILSTGHLPPDTYHNLKGMQNYYDDPWSNESFLHIPEARSVGVLGTRLTAIDTALRLQSMNYQGKISMVSRSGMLPTVLSKEIPPYHLKYVTLQTLNRLTNNNFNPLKLKDLFRLVQKEIQDAMKGKSLDFNKIAKSYKDISPKEWLRKEITEAETPKPWQQVLFALFPIIPHIWRILEENDKKEFMKNYYSVFLTYLAAFPLENAKKIYSMLDSGQLNVVGGIQGVAHTQTQYTISTLEENIKVDALFNATGPGFDLKLNPLFAQMEKQGSITRNDLGGIRVDPLSFQVCNNEGRPYPSMYAMGNLTIGEYLATSDMSQVAFQASVIAARLARELSLEKHSAKSATVFISQEPLTATKDNKRQVYDC